MLTAITQELVIEIGGMPILVRTESAEFARLLEKRYGSFITTAVPRPAFELEIELAPPGSINPDESVRVRLDRGRWVMERGDFRAEWDLERHRGWVRQTANPYSIDSVLRILHSLILAREGGFLVHAASAVRHGRAFLFSGLSGAGKTTLTRLALPDTTLLSDEVSYVRREPEGYRAFGTPFAGELGKSGENVSAPVGALYLLAQGPENRIEPLATAEAARRLLENILFFAEDAELVKSVFASACEFVSRVPVSRLAFVPDGRVWEMIG